MAQAWHTLANDPNFYQPLSEYGVGTGRLASISNTNWNLPAGQVSDAYIRQEMQAEIDGGDLPGSDSNSIYVFVLPSGTQQQDDVGKYSGYHSQFNSMSYAVVEYNSDFGQMDVIVSHEIYECSSDPNGYGVYGVDGEIGDLCQGNGYWLDGYLIQQVWGQSACKCVP